MKSETPFYDKQIGIVDQIAVAFKQCNILPTIMGSVVGGIVPIASYWICHYECKESPAMWFLVAGGLVYSAMTVFSWSKIAFKHPVKALGFVTLLEGAMTFSSTVWLSVSCLSILVFINAISASCQLVLDRRQSRRK
jgi:hypothetical protein